MVSSGEGLLTLALLTYPCVLPLSDESQVSSGRRSAAHDEALSGMSTTASAAKMSVSVVANSLSAASQRMAGKVIAHAVFNTLFSIFRAR